MSARLSLPPSPASPPPPLLLFLALPGSLQDSLPYGSAGTLEMRLAVLFASSVYVPRHIGSFTTNSQQQAEQFAVVVWCISPHKTTGAVSLGIVFCAGHLKDWHRKK